MKWMITILGVMITLASFSAMSESSQSKHKPAMAKPILLKLSPKQLHSMQIVWQKPRASDAQMSTSYPAEVVLPSSQTRLVATTQAGLIEQLNVSVGDQVKKGQVLGRIASQSLVSLQSAFLQASTQARLHNSAFNRDRDLFNDGIIAQRRFLETKSAHETSQAMLSEHKQALRLAGMSDRQISQLAKSQQLASSIQLYAPITGQVTEQLQQVGARVEMASPVFTISQTKPLWLMIQVPVEQAQTMQIGMAVKVNPLQLTAKVEAILRTLNKQNQTVSVRARLFEGAERLSVGQIVNVNMLYPSASNAFRVPKSALLFKDQHNYLFVKQGLGVAVLAVQLLQTGANEVIVTGRLNQTTEVAVQGIAALKGVWLGMGESQ